MTKNLLTFAQIRLTKIKSNHAIAKKIHVIFAKQTTGLRQPMKMKVRPRNEHRCCCTAGGADYLGVGDEMIIYVLVYAVAAWMVISSLRNLKYYNLPQKIVQGVFGNVLLGYSCSKIYAVLSNLEGDGITEALLFCLGLTMIVDLGVSMCCWFPYGPLLLFFENYNHIKDGVMMPRLDYSLWVKMRKVGPEFFDECTDVWGKELKCLHYHGTLYGLGFITYIRVLLYIAREKKAAEKKRQHSWAIYRIMQEDLEAKMREIVKDKEAAYGETAKATENISEIIKTLREDS